MNKFQWNI